MGVIPKDKMPKNAFIKGSEFGGKGLNLTILGVDYIKPNNPDKYGAKDTDYLVKSGVLKVGETVRYSFTTKDEFDFDTVRTFESKSARMYVAFSQANPDKGQTVHISRSGNGTDTHYKVEIVIPTVKTDE